MVPSIFSALKRSKQPKKEGFEKPGNDENSEATPLRPQKLTLDSPSNREQPMSRVLRSRNGVLPRLELPEASSTPQPAAPAARTSASKQNALVLAVRARQLERSDSRAASSPSASHKSEQAPSPNISRPHLQTRVTDQSTPPNSDRKRRAWNAGTGRQVAGRSLAGSLTARSSSAISHADTVRAADDNVKVLLRVRPLNQRELETGGRKCVQQISKQSVRVMIHPEPQIFSFDEVLGESQQQDSIFAAVRGKVDSFLEGFNSTVFAYGQTGSGKTYTMLGDTAQGLQSEGRGLMPRVFEHLFSQIDRRHAADTAGSCIKITCRCSFLEIYNETICDLLSSSSQLLSIREDAKLGVYVEGLQQQEVTSAEGIIELLAEGSINRHVGETNMNRESSRSHSVFQCRLESRTADSKGLVNVRTSQLNLVDLAGSERQNTSGALRAQLKEASSINKSLSTLGLVIMSLVEQQHRGSHRHIPYRDSRLTFLLQDALGGNAQCTMIYNISPCNFCLSETLSTLRFAQRAKSIKNKAVVNEDASGSNAQLKAEVQRLKEALAATRAELDAHKTELAFSQAPQQTQLTAEALQQNSLATPLGRLSRSIEGLPPFAPYSPPGHDMSPQASVKALMGALRREALVKQQLDRLQAELEANQDLLKQRDTDAQRSKMIVKLKETHIARLQVNADQKGMAYHGDLAEEMRLLKQELEIYKQKLSNNPEVKRFAVENLRLSEELREVRQLADQNETAALKADIDVLREQLLCMADQPAAAPAQRESVQSPSPFQQAYQAALADSALQAEQLAGQEAIISDLQSQLSVRACSRERELVDSDLAASRLEDEIEALRAEISAQTAISLQYRMELEEANASMASVRLVAANAEQKAERLAASLEELTASLQQKDRLLAAMRAQLAAHIADATRHHEQLVSDCAQRTCENAALCHQVESLEARIAEANQGTQRDEDASTEAGTQTQPLTASSPELKTLPVADGGSEGSPGMLATLNQLELTEHQLAILRDILPEEVWIRVQAQAEAEFGGQDTELEAILVHHQAVINSLQRQVDEYKRQQHSQRLASDAALELSRRACRREAKRADVAEAAREASMAELSGFRSQGKDGQAQGDCLTKKIATAATSS